MDWRGVRVETDKGEVVAELEMKGPELEVWRGGSAGAGNHERLLQATLCQ